jgi:hypothetical protein
MSANENEKETYDKSKENNSIHENGESVNRDENENKINNGEEEGEEKEGNDGAQEEERQPFWYFGEINKEIIDQSIFEKGKYKYCICLLMKDESKNSSLLLYKTIKGISLNLNKLEEEIDIKGEHIALFIFINHIDIHNELFFTENDINILEEKKYNFLMRERTINEENSKLLNLKVFTISNNNYLSDVSSLKLYYSFLEELKDEKKLMFSSVITAGVYPLEGSLLSLIQSSYHTEKKHGIAVAPIEYKPINIFSKISLYDKIHFNIYDMNYYFESSSIPVSSLLCTMCFGHRLLKNIIEFYNSLNNNASISFHDYNLGLKLMMKEKRRFFIKYNYDKALGMIEINNMTYLDYQKQWINRNSGYYGNFFEILRNFGNFSMCTPEEKIFLFFQIISMAIEFILPSLVSMVVYATLFEAFNSYDYRIALFFTSLYLCMMFASGVCSLITKEPSKMPTTNYILYFFMEVFYAFVIICSIPAMDNINKGKGSSFDYDSGIYKFNKAGAAILIILCFIIYIIPMIIKVSIIGNNFISMLFYLLLGAPCSTSNFNIAKVWNASDTSGGYELETKKALCIIIHLCFNLFFGCLSFYNTTRRKRANCVMGLAIFFLIYSFFRTFAIIIKLVCSKEESFDNKTLCDKIKDELEKEEEISSKKDEDVNSEEKKIKSRDFNENEENDGNENIQNNEEDDNNNEHNENNNSQENQNDGENDG